MKLRTGDKVKVITGKDKGKISTVLKVLPSKNKVIVEDVNKVKKHVKPGQVSEEGGIIEIEKPIDASNVMYYEESEKAVTRIGFKFEDGKKVRISKKTGKVLKSKED
ncbi:50S ribosomal protein L24 [candidate division WWE3 bacterium]|nr:50S ribosomal protein L24 [candidate division WWE3 bacterium]